MGFSSQGVKFVVLRNNMDTFYSSGSLTWNLNQFENCNIGISGVRNVQQSRVNHGSGSVIERNWCRRRRVDCRHKPE